MKDQWRKYTDRIKKGSGKSPIEEPEWYKIINPIFSDTHGNLEIASKASDAESVRCGFIPRQRRRADRYKS